MKKTVSIVATMLLLQTAAVLLVQPQISLANDNECEKAFGQAVAACAQASPSSQKACVQAAKEAKEACKSGVNLCLDACQTTYDSGVAVCEWVYDPANCFGNLACEQGALQNRADCISIATYDLNNCTASCLR